MKTILLFVSLGLTLALLTGVHGNVNTFPSPYPTANGLADDTDIFLSANADQLYFYGSIDLPETGVVTWDSPQEGFVNDVIYPCENHYYRLDAAQFNDFVSGDYLHLDVCIRNNFLDTTATPSFNPNLPEPPNNSTLTIYVSYDPTGENPPLADGLFSDGYLDVWGENFDTTSASSGYKWPDSGNSQPCNQQFYEVPPCLMHDEGYYWIVVGNFAPASYLEVEYNIFVSRRRPAGTCVGTSSICEDESVTEFSVTSVTDDDHLVARFTALAYLNDTRAPQLLQQFDYNLGTTSPQTFLSAPASANNPMLWRYFSLDLSDYEEAGAYIVLNFSNVVTTFGQFAYSWQFGSVPYHIVHSSISTYEESCNNQNISCTGNCDIQALADGFNTCLLTIDSCDIVFGQTLYIGILMGNSYNPFVLTGLQFGSGERSTTVVDLMTSFNISAAIYRPQIQTLTLDNPIYADGVTDNKDLLWTTDDYYRFDLTADDLSPRSDLWIVVSGYHSTANVTFFGEVGTTNPTEFFCSGCKPQTGDCSAVFRYSYCDSTLNEPGTYLITVSGSGSYSIEAFITEKPIPQILEAGIPTQATIVNDKYDYYVINVPVFTADSWLYVEIFSTGVEPNLLVSLLAGDIPNDICNAVEGDYQCRTTEGAGTNCFFMVDPCFLEPGPIYLTVHSESSEVQAYTLWAEFETAWELQNNVTYSDIVFTNQYNHYYIKVDEVVEGSWLTVEVDNAQIAYFTSWDDAADATYNTFLNYGSLAGSCPCYNSLYNCTGSVADPTDCAASADGDNCADLNDHDLSYVTYPDYSSIDGSLNPIYPDSNNTLTSCCKLYADGCDFRAGIWYISVLGLPSDDPHDSLNSDYRLSSIGYTITAIIHPPPPVFELPVGSPLVDWVDYDQSNHYQIQTDFKYGEDLVVKVTWMQDACFREIKLVGSASEGYLYTPLSTGIDLVPTDFSGQVIELRLAAGSLALPECYAKPWSCSISAEQEHSLYASCTIVVPNCEWSKLATEGDMFASVTYRIVGDEPYPSYAQITLEAETVRPFVTHLTPNVPVTGVVSQNQYAHYLLRVDQELFPTTRLDILAYFNTRRTNPLYPSGDEPSYQPTLAIQFDRKAGGLRACPDCMDYALSCTDPNICSLSLDPCYVAQHGESDWYFSVFYPANSFYDQKLDFTLTVNSENAVVDLDISDITSRTYRFEETFYSGNALLPEQPYPQRHYRFTFNGNVANDADYLKVIVRSEKSVKVYFNIDEPAGDSCCYSSFCSATTGTGGDCPFSAGSSNSFFIDSKGLTPGIAYYINVQATSSEVQELYWIEFEYYTFEINDEREPITSTIDDGTVFHLGHNTEETFTSPLDFRLGHLFLGDYNDGVDTFDAWLTDSNGENRWNENNLWLDQTLVDGQLKYYPVEITDGDINLVYIGMDNVYIEDCPYEAEIDFYYVGCADDLYSLLDHSRCGNNFADITSKDLLFTAVSNEASFVQLGYCAAACTQTHWFAASVKSTTPNNAVVHFDLRMFLQEPISLLDETAFFTNDFNTTHLNNLIPFDSLSDGFKQRFVLDDDTIADGTAPITQIVIERYLDASFNPISTAPIYVRISPQKPSTYNANDLDCCYQDPSCVEFRNGIASSDLENGEFFATTPSDSVQVTRGANYVIPPSFQGPLGDGTYVCTALQCTFSLMPCALRSEGTRWYIDISTNTSDSYNQYYIYYVDLGDVAPESSWIPITDSEVQSREIFPTISGPAETIYDLDTYFIYTWDMEDYTPYNNNENFRGRLEIQTYYDTPDACTTNCQPALGITYIARVDELDASNLPIPAILNWADASNAPGNNTDFDAFSCCFNPFYTCTLTNAGTPASSSCASTGSIFVIPECSLSLTDKFFIVVRVVTPGAVGFRTQVRVVEPQCDPGASNSCEDITNANPQFTIPTGVDNALTIEAADHSSDGVEAASWNHYRVLLQDFVPTDTLIVDLGLDIDSTDSDLASIAGTLYLRLSYLSVVQHADANTLLGSLTGRNEYGQVIDDYCQDYEPLGGDDNAQWQCALSGFSSGVQEQRCILQVPNEELKTGIWFISIYNDLWFQQTVTSGAGLEPANDPSFTNYKGFNVSVYLKPFNTPELFTISGSDDSACADLVSQPGIVELDNDSTDDPLLVYSTSYLSSNFNGVYEYYSIVLTEEDLDLICTDEATDSCLYEHTFTITVENYDDPLDLTTEPANINVLFYAPQSLRFVNDGPFSFVDRSQYWNTANSANLYGADLVEIAQEDNVFNASITYQACPSRYSVALRPGEYIIVVQTTIENSYYICASLDWIDHDVFVRDEITDADTLVEFGDESVWSLWSFENIPDPSSVTDRQDDWYFRFRIENADLVEGDGYPYLQFWVNDIVDCGLPDGTNNLAACEAQGVSSPTLSINIFRDDCQVWSADANDAEQYGISVAPPTTASNIFSQYSLLERYVIDGEGLALCGLDAGTYFIHINSPNDELYWDFEVYLRYPQLPLAILEPNRVQDIKAFATLDPDVNNLVSTAATIWQYQYQVYEATIESPDQLYGLTVRLDQISCGTLELWANLGSPGGPDRMSDIGTDTAEGCHYKYASCNTSSCEISLDACHLFNDFGADGETATWYFTVYGSTQDNKFINDFFESHYTPTDQDFSGYNAPVSYIISLIYSDYVVKSDLPFGCKVSLEYATDTVGDNCLVPDNDLDADQLADASTLQRFQWNVESLSLFGRLSLSTSGITTSWSNCYPYGETYKNFHAQTPDQALSAPYQRNALCVSGPVIVSPFVEGVSGSTVTLTRNEFYVPTIHPGVTYYGSVAIPDHFDDSAYYIFEAPETGYFAFFIESTDGNVTWSFRGDADCNFCSTGWTDLNAHELLCSKSHPRYLRIEPDQHYCEHPCKPIQFSFHYEIYPAFFEATCGESYCFEESPDQWYLFDSNNAGVWEAENNEWFGQIRSVTGSAVTRSYAPDFCSLEKCPDDDYIFYAGNAGDVEVSCDVVPIINLGDLTTTLTDTKTNVNVVYYRFSLPESSYPFSKFTVNVAGLCDSDYNVYLHYERLPSENCYFAYGDLIETQCNPTPGAYYLKVVHNSGVADADGLTQFTLTITLITYDTVELQLDQWLQTSLLAGESKVFFVDTTTSANPALDSSLNVEIVLNSGQGLVINGLGDIQHGFGSLGNCYVNYYPGYEGNYNYVPFCAYAPGVYYSRFFSSDDVTFSLSPSLVSAGIVPTALSLPYSSSGFETVSLSFFDRQWNYYSVAVSLTDPDFDSLMTQLRLANVQGGALALAADPHFFFPNTPNTTGYNSFGESVYFSETPLQYSAEYSADGRQQCYNADYNCHTFTGVYTADDTPPNNYAGSCTITILPCVWTAYDTWIVVVSPQYESDNSGFEQSNRYQAISYQLVVETTQPTILTSSSDDSFSPSDWEALPAYTAQANRQQSYVPGNVESFYFQFDAEDSSARIILDVSGQHSTDGVWVQIYDSSCETCQSTSYWCGAEYDQWVCEYQVSTSAEYTTGSYFVMVTVGSGSFTISAKSGLENCQFPEHSGSLEFCTGLVDYPAWEWTTFSTRDAEARCLYEALVEDFKSASCDILCATDLSFGCLQALQRFACYESFRPCDEQGFQTSTCRAACQTVESQCQRTFSGSGYSQYSCSSYRYIDDEDHPELHCAGSLLQLTEEDAHAAFVPDILASFDNFKQELLDNVINPEKDSDYGWEAPRADEVIDKIF